MRVCSRSWFLIRFLILNEVFDEVLDSQWGSCPRTLLRSWFWNNVIEILNEKKKFRKGEECQNKTNLIQIQIANKSVAPIESRWKRDESFTFNISTKQPKSLNYSTVYTTSCPGAQVAPRHAASRHADQQYGQSRNIKYSTFRDPGGYRVKVMICDN